LILGVGTDIVETKRVSEKIKKENGFREAVFSPDEILYCESKKNKSEHYAARFAAKEAFLKALGTGWQFNHDFSEIEIRNDTLGKPDLFLKGKIAQITSELNIVKMHVSMSHVSEFANAVVILEIAPL
jgi:holo-[acyl-carrier protein] synthase